VSLYGGLNGGFVPIHTIDNTGAPWPQQWRQLENPKTPLKYSRFREWKEHVWYFAQ
jgi:hypothetical protein